MSTSGHDKKGRFAEGNPGGPGRPRRAVERDYLAALSENVSLEEWRDIVQAAVSKAKEGDCKARDWLTKYLIGDKPLTLADLDADPGHPFKLGGPGDVLALLGEQIEAVRATPTTPAERARGIAPLAALSLKALELYQLTARLEALEASLKKRTAGGVGG